MTDDRPRELATNLERIVVNRDVNVVKPRYSEVVSNNGNNLYRNRIQLQADRQSHRIMRHHTIELNKVFLVEKTLADIQK